MMEFSVETQGEVVVLKLRGPIHAEDNDAFAKALDGLRERGAYRVVVDGEKLDYVNSRAVGTLVAFTHDARIRDGRVAILRPNATVGKVLKSVGLLSLVPRYDTLEEAVSACREQKA